MAAPQYTYDPKSPLPDLVPVFSYELKNVPGMSILGGLVKFAPGGATPPHRHAGASVTAYVVEGTVYNKMNNDPLEVLEAGSSWYEAPGCHHVVSANYSDSKPATIMAIFVVETEVIAKGGLGALVIYDEEYQHLNQQLPSGSSPSL